MSNIFLSDMAKSKIINEKLVYEKLNGQKTIPQLTYYTKSYSIINHEKIEHGSGFILSFVEVNKNYEKYKFVNIEGEFFIFIGPSAMFDRGVHFINWSDGKFKLDSI